MGLFDQTFLKGSRAVDVEVTLPASYRRRVDWVPRIGDIFPNFTAETTTGHLDFHDWAEGRWVHLFNCPKLGGAVTSTELASFSAAAPEFDQRGVVNLGLVQATKSQQIGFEVEIERLFDVRVNFPVVLDQAGHLSRILGMFSLRDSYEHAVRKSFLIDPSLKVRGLFEYPLNVGRSVDEILRLTDAHQLRDRSGLVTPADWLPGDDALIPESVPASDAMARYGDAISYYSPALRGVPTAGR
ncbi:redoxin domain-containing protein [Anianabacter salinae]|uniref:redoxin domain-containing protein n=1 Tax=Anianabacter salinae TaxID=2851023 RepID=UPI00225E1823|nr:redoxin domain-containing protein [Anianabacter salinae]MBV0912547.1 redoxin domain-containing protein [Anianabacter salinae]